MLVGLRAATRAYGKRKIDDEGPQIGSRRAQGYGGDKDSLLTDPASVEAVDRAAVDDQIVAEQ
jgi:hypothetical protein